MQLTAGRSGTNFCDDFHIQPSHTRPRQRRAAWFTLRWSLILCLVRWYRHAGCVLHVRGEEFDVDAFLAESTLRPYQVHRRGDPRRYHGGRHDDSGFSLDVSDIDGDLHGQVADAMRLLAEWEPELQ